MKPFSFIRGNARTQHVQLATENCLACWKCLDVCPNNVIHKVDLPWHKHSLISNPYSCTGCLKCVKICEYAALSKIDKTKQESEKQRKKIWKDFLINNTLLVSGCIMVISGLTLQFRYHLGDHSHNKGDLQLSTYEQVRGIDSTKIVCNFNYTE